MSTNTLGRWLRTLRTDISFLVTLGLILATAATALTGLIGDDEGEFLNLDDDLHALAGWSMVVFAGAHTLLHLGQLTGYARRRYRRLFGVGGVVDASKAPQVRP
jgi:hypothetical protein